MKFCFISKNYKDKLIEIYYFQMKQNRNLVSSFTNFIIVEVLKFWLYVKKEFNVNFNLNFNFINKYKIMFEVNFMYYL